MVVVEHFVLLSPLPPRLHPLGKYSAHVSSLCPTSARHPGPRPRRLPPPPGSLLPRITPRAGRRRAAASTTPPPPTLHPRPPTAGHSHHTTIPSPASKSSLSCVPKPLSQSHSPMSRGWKLDTPFSQPQPSAPCPGQRWISPHPSKSLGCPPFPSRGSTGDKLLRQF